jgi:hypothetical protein
MWRGRDKEGPLAGRWGGTSGAQRRGLTDASVEGVLLSRGAILHSNAPI